MLRIAEIDEFKGQWQARTLTTLLLLRAGYEYVPYASLENIIEGNKDLCSKVLRRTQETLKNEAPDWKPWIFFSELPEKTKS